MKRRNFALLLLTALLGSCEREVKVVETPLTPTVGAINARYTVDKGKTVVFAKGNLQYQASTGTWRFASNQYDVIGLGNEQVSSTYSGWIDLFGWATSGYEGMEPYMDTMRSECYGPMEGEISNTDFDWGKVNGISNGGEKAGLWHTLSYDEFYHVVYLRDAASVKRAEATIKQVGEGSEDVYGLMLLPDNWTLPEGCTFKPGAADGFSTNVYTPDQWNKLQNAGAVFLPAGGYRDGHAVSLLSDYGCYWTGSSYTTQAAYELYFMSARYEFSTAARANGHCIRLVQYK